MFIYFHTFGYHLQFNFVSKPVYLKTKGKFDCTKIQTNKF